MREQKYFIKKKPSTSPYKIKTVLITCATHEKTAQWKNKTYIILPMLFYAIKNRG